MLMLFGTTGLVVLFVLAHIVHAATPNLVIVPPTGLIRSGETVALTLRVDSGGENINAVEGVLTYPVDRLRFVRVSREQSILTLWTEEPAADTRTGTVTFTGGRPGGIVADNAALFTVYFEAYKSGDTTLSFDASRSALYKHDGEGTKIPVSPAPVTMTVTDSLVEGIVLTSSTHPTADTWSRGGRIVVSWPVVPGALYSYDLSTDAEHLPDDAQEAIVGNVAYEALSDGIYFFVIKEHPDSGDWSAVAQRRFLLDATPPRPFVIEQPDPATVGGAQLIAWTTTDTTSGIARYDLTVNGSDPLPVRSPLMLDPAWLGKKLTITAVDAAGNMQAGTWEYNASSARGFPWRTVALFVGIVVVLAAVIAVVVLPRGPKLRKR